MTSQSPTTNTTEHDIPHDSSNNQSTNNPSIIDISENQVPTYQDTNNPVPIVSDDENTDITIHQVPKISPKASIFIKYYLDPNSPTFCVQYMSYIRAYYPQYYEKVKEYYEDDQGNRVTNKAGKANFVKATIPPNITNIANVESRKLTKQPNIIQHMELFNQSQGFNDLSVDSQHNKLIHQAQSETVQIQAIKHYNELKQRVKTQ
jgi:hypothetical protein